MKNPVWQRERVTKKIRKLGFRLQDFCVRNKLGTTNTLNSDLNHGRFPRDIAERLAKGLGISLDQLLAMGAVIINRKERK